jgi:flavin reductase (DIM6/NTAB) family NADH-FMN oxidoreductase RutF
MPESAPAHAVPHVDPTAYRRALGVFGTGVALVCARDQDGRCHGMIINSLTSVSLAPPIVLWCVADTSAVFGVYTGCPVFSINILGHGEEELARQFSRKGDRIVPEDLLETFETGAPVLRTAAANLDCQMRRHERVGDHEVVYGDVRAFRADPAIDALGFFRGRFVKLSSAD